MSKLKALKEFGKKFFGKKKKIPEEIKTDLSKIPTSKNIDELIKNEGDPFVRNAYISMREKAKRGDVVDRGGNVIGTPSKERSAKTLMDRNRGSRQFGKKDGGRIGLKEGTEGILRRKLIGQFKTKSEDKTKQRRPKVERMPMPRNRRPKAEPMPFIPNKKRKIERMPFNPNKKQKFELLNKGGRVGLRAGSKGCKLAMKGKGRAYGKNS